jgi:PKD repeat protein
MKNSRGFGLLPVLVIIAALFSTGAYFYFQKQSATTTSGALVATSTSQTQTSQQNTVKVPPVSKPLDAVLVATPTSGPAPLMVRFTQTATDDWRAVMDYGDGKVCAVDGVGNEDVNCSSKFVHTYTVPGTYTAKLRSSTGTDSASRPPLGTVTITVTGTHPTATIDQNSLTITNSSNPVITGTFSGNSLSDISILIFTGQPPAILTSESGNNIFSSGPMQTFVNGQASTRSYLSNGRYYIEVEPLQPGTYKVGVYSAKHLLTSDTLTVTQ